MFDRSPGLSASSLLSSVTLSMGRSTNQRARSFRARPPRSLPTCITTGPSKKSSCASTHLRRFAAPPCRSTSTNATNLFRRNRKRALRFPEAPPSITAFAIRLALRELEGLAGLGAAVLLALDDAAVAGQEAVRLQDRAQRRLIVGQGVRQAVADGAGLARQARALDRADDVELGLAAGDDQR